MSRKIKTALVLTSILIYAILKDIISKFYSKVILSIFDVFGVTEESITTFINNYVRHDEVIHEATLGKIIYHPTYLCLHVLFIYILFEKKRIRNYIIVGFLSIVFVLVFGGIIFRIIGWDTMSAAFINPYRKLFSAPLILLIIEGGRILYDDLMNAENDI